MHAPIPRAFKSQIMTPNTAKTNVVLAAPKKYELSLTLNVITSELELL
jgi:hypothetical protein